MTLTSAELEALPQEQYIALLEQLNEDYHNYEDEDGAVAKHHALSDRTYDFYVEVYERRFGKWTRVGAPAVAAKRPWQRKVEPPVYLGSLDKITKKEQLELWCKKQPGTYVDSAKIDGCSALYELESSATGAPCKLSTRGRDGVGIDIAHLLPFIKLPKRDTTADGAVLGVRGELVILTSQFALLQEERRAAGLKPLTDPRSTVAGMCTGKTIDLRTGKYMSFIAYQAFTHSWTRLEKPSRQFALLQELSFNVPWFRASPSDTESHDFDEVTRTTLALKQELDYPIDGLVLAQDVATDVPEAGKDPAYARAFKVQADCAETVVTRVEWGVTTNWVKPVVHVVPVVINGRTLSKFSGKNAAWIVKHKVGAGSLVRVTFANEIIPDGEILSVATSGEPELPTHLETEWNENHVELMLKDRENNETTKQQQLERFFRKLKGDGLGPANILKMYERFKGDWHAILLSKPADYAKIEGLGAKSAVNICDAIKACTTNVPLPRLMAASGLFGLGLGETKLKAVVAVYPNIMRWRVFAEEEIGEYARGNVEGGGPVSVEEAIAAVLRVKLFAAMADQFVAKLPAFQQFCESLPMVTYTIPVISAAKALASRKRTKEEDEEEEEKKEDFDDEDDEEDDKSEPPTPAAKKLTAAGRAKLARAAIAVGGGENDGGVVAVAAAKGPAIPSPIVCTGFRFAQAVQDQLEAADVQIAGSVSKKTQLLLIKEHGGKTSSSEMKARELGVPILSRDEFCATYGIIQNA